MVRARPAKVMCWNSKRTQQSRVRGKQWTTGPEGVWNEIVTRLERDWASLITHVVSTHHQLQHLPWLAWTPHVRYKAREVLGSPGRGPGGRLRFPSNLREAVSQSTPRFLAPVSREAQPPSGLRGPWHRQSSRGKERFFHVSSTHTEHGSIHTCQTGLI